MIEPTPFFDREVREAWGNPVEAAMAALNEMTRHGSRIGLSFDDRVRFSRDISVLTVEMMDGNVDDFITAFVIRILNAGEVSAKARNRHDYDDS